MDEFANLIECVINMLKIEFTLWGFTFSLWSVFIWGILATLVVWTIKKIFGGDD